MCNTPKIIPSALVDLPNERPFLAAIGWHANDIKRLTLDEMLNLYKGGLKYRGVLAELEDAARTFFNPLAKVKGSWRVVKDSNL